MENPWNRRKNPLEIRRDSVEIPLHSPCSQCAMAELTFSSRTLWGVIDCRKKFDNESSSEVRKMLGCFKCKYENCIFIFRRLYYIQYIVPEGPSFL